MILFERARVAALLLAFGFCSPVRAASLGAASPEDARSAAFEFEGLDAAAAARLDAGTSVPAPPASAGNPSALDWNAILDRLPSTSATKDGSPDSPVNLIFVGSEEEIRGAIRAANWTAATTSLAKSMADGVLHLILVEKLDVFPPVSAEYLFGRRQDMGFLRQLDLMGSRHHFRLWRTPFSDPDGRPVWFGTASMDLNLRYSNGRVTHRIDPDLDRERDYIMSTLASGPPAAGIRYFPHPRAVRAGGDSNGDPYATDGRVLTLFFPSRN